ncbi:hypothetical protein RvY_12494 [Ramazzottius varieornatus]|uniref:Uncharacterized protein n=1 Tax=Ramazzottius varieornatus TaxID=947166 RepID=A0A1D1VJR6_RAMVA|nr:hypothetical protein RvY_12494 [Ramazzottius varieornatus]
MEEGPPASKPDAAARRWLTEELVPSGPVFNEVKSLWQLYSSLDDSTRSSSQGIPLPLNQDHNRYCAGGPLVANRRTQVTPLSVLQRISDDSQPVAPPSKKRALSIDSRQDELGLQRGVVAQEDRVIEKLTVHLQKNSK